jgi:WhiB family redox-sensing transcriptional regulator
MANYRKLVTKDQPWMKKAACRDAATYDGSYDRFYPEENTEVQSALELCKPCGVRAQCLDLALVNREHQGIWGGKTGRQRETERRRRAATMHEFETGVLPVIEDVAAVMACTPDSMSRFLWGLEVSGGTHEGAMSELQGVRS